MAQIQQLQRKKEQLDEAIRGIQNSEAVRQLRESMKTLDQDSDEYIEVLQRIYGMTQKKQKERSDIQHKIWELKKTSQEQAIYRYVDSLIKRNNTTTTHDIMNRLNQLTDDNDLKRKALRILYPPRPSKSIIFSFHEIRDHRNIRMRIDRFPSYLLGVADNIRHAGVIYNDIDGIRDNAEWFREQEQYLQTLTREQIELVTSYSQMDFEYFNHPDNANQSDVRELNRIIKKSPKLKHELIVWRGTSRYIKQQTTTMTKIFQYKGFVSTSMLLKAPLRFMDNECCLVKIRLKRGSTCLFLQPLLGKKNRDEMEILLPQRTRLQIQKTDIHIINDSNYADIDRRPFDREIIQAQVINNKWYWF